MNTEIRTEPTEQACRTAEFTPSSTSHLSTTLASALHATYAERTDPPAPGTLHRV